MENAVEALKIAGAVLLFILALSLSISSLSQANSAVSDITTMYDREFMYNYMKPSKGLTRTVGVDTIVPTMYEAYEENIKIFFKNSTGESIPIYYKTNQYGRRVNAEGKAVDNSNSDAVKVDYIDLAEEGFSAEKNAATNHLSMLLAGKSNWENDEDIEKYKNQFIYENGFYDYLSKHTFTESLGEYYQGNDSTKIKKRIIVYQLVE